MPLDQQSPDAMRIREILKHLDKLVNEFGPLHKVPCFYVDKEGKQPVCIAGHVLFRMGVTLEQLASWEGQAAFQVVDNFLGWGTPAAVVLTMAQHVQDGDRTWGEALQSAYAAANAFGVI